MEAMKLGRLLVEIVKWSLGTFIGVELFLGLSAPLFMPVGEVGEFLLGVSPLSAIIALIVGPYCGVIMWMDERKRTRRFQDHEVWNSKEVAEERRLLQSASAHDWKRTRRRLLIHGFRRAIIVILLTPLALVFGMLGAFLNWGGVEEILPWDFPLAGTMGYGMMLVILVAAVVQIFGAIRPRPFVVVGRIIDKRTPELDEGSALVTATGIVEGPEVDLMIRNAFRITRSGARTNMPNWQHNRQTLRCDKRLFRHLHKGEPIVLVCLSNGRALARLRDILSA